MRERRRRDPAGAEKPRDQGRRTGRYRGPGGHCIHDFITGGRTGETARRRRRRRDVHAAAGADFHQPGPDESAADSRTGRKPADIRHHRSDPRKTGSAAEGSDRAPDRHGAAPAADGFLHVQGRYEAFPVKRSGI